MEKKTRVLETVKTCLIVLLSLSALGLAARTRLFNAFISPQRLFGGIFTAGQPAGDGENVPYREAAVPVNIVLSTEGGHYTGDVQSLYESCGSLLGEALGSSREPATATAADFHSALADNSIYYEYSDPVRLSVLAGWFGTEISHSGGETLVRRLCVSAGSVEPILYYMDAVSGTVYRCGTAASATSLKDLTAGISPNGAHFLFELDTGYRQVDPYSLLPGSSLSLPLLNASSALGSYLTEDALLSQFGMNAYISSRRTEANQEQVYVEGRTMLRADSHGFVTFRQEADGDLLPILQKDADEAAAIEACRAFLTALSDAIGGEGQFALRSCTATETGFSLSFSICVNGLPVSLPGDCPGAEIEIENGRILQAAVYCRHYSAGQEGATLLPALQATAIAERLDRAEAVPGWMDSLGQDMLSPQWLLRKGD